MRREQDVVERNSSEANNPSQQMGESEKPRAGQDERGVRPEERGVGELADARDIDTSIVGKGVVSMHEQNRRSEGGEPQ